MKPEEERLMEMAYEAGQNDLPLDELKETLNQGEEA